MQIFRIEHRGAKWVVQTEDGSRDLGEHDTKEAAEAQLRAIEARKAAGAARMHRGLFGPLVRFDVARDDSGKVRVGVWDRAATFGTKPKDGVETVFSVETFGQMVDNWLSRGERLSACYNHQSAYTEENGQPAPALAYYDAVAIVKDEKVVRCEALHISQATPPDLAVLKTQVAVLATDENPDPSPDGLWWYRCEVTEPIGQLLLPTLQYLSPMFVPDGQNEFGESQGYTIYDLAATNTAFQAGCIICFDRGGRALVRMDFAVGDRVEVRSLADDRRKTGVVKAIASDAFVVAYPDGSEERIANQEVRKLPPKAEVLPQASAPEPAFSTKRGTTMAKKFDEEMAKRLGLDEGADEGAVKKAFARRMEEARGLLSKEDDDKKLLDQARRLDEEAAAYEAAFGADGDEEKPHVEMRRLAAKMRRMAKMEEPAPVPEEAHRLDDEPFAGKEAPAEEAAEKEFLGRMKADGVPDDEAKQMARMGRRFGLDLRRATRRTVLAAAAAGSVPAARVESMVNQKLAAALQLERGKREQKERVEQATTLFESAVAGGYPADMREEFITFATANLDAAKKVFKSYVKQGSQLFERVTHSGAPVGGSRSGSGTAPTQIRQHGAIRVVKYACDFAAEARKLAREKGIKYEAALDQVQREKPELYEQYLQQSS